MAKYAPAVIGAERAGAVLIFDFEKVAGELSLFAGPGASADSSEIIKHLTDLKKLGMSFEPNGDLKMMLSGAVPSRLPELINMV